MLEEGGIITIGKGSAALTVRTIIRKAPQFQLHSRPRHRMTLLDNIIHQKTQFAALSWMSNCFPVDL
jgi:hypothetical protein